MFDEKLIEFFSSIGVGLVGALLIVYFYFLIKKLFVKDKFNRHAFVYWLRNILREDLTKTGYAIILSIFVYAFGILIQDLTDYMTDSDEGKLSFARLFKKTNLLPTELEMRQETLFKNDHEMTPLGSEIFNNDSISRLINTRKSIALFSAGNADSIWNAAGANILEDKDQRKKFKANLNIVYYTAKNWCYLESPSARQELQSIQNRIDFSRSIFVLCVLALICLTIIFLTYFIREFSKKKAKRFQVIEYGKEIRLYFVPRLSLVILIPALFILRNCYSVAEINFNERAFGYYVTHLQLHKSGDAIAGK